MTIKRGQKESEKLYSLTLFYRLYFSFKSFFIEGDNLKRLNLEVIIKTT